MKIGCYAMFLLSLMLLVSSAPAAEPIPAFPGAEGWGAYTTGGRGGKVIHVTNLNTSGPGSFQAACSQQGARIVVFDTSGVINAPVTIEHGGITIMGQSAPGAGITILGKLAAESNDSSRLGNIVVRFLRVRPSQLAQGDGSDQDAIQFNMVEHTVLDHISVAWSTDENIGFYQARYSTVQWCSIEEACAEGHYKGRHNYGMLCGPVEARSQFIITCSPTTAAVTRQWPTAPAMCETTLSIISATVSCMITRPISLDLTSWATTTSAGLRVKISGRSVLQTAPYIS